MHTLQHHCNGVLALTMHVCISCRKLDEKPVDDQLRATIREICQQLVAAINKYYAFGSAFVDEAS